MICDVTRSVAVAYAADYFDSGAFLADLGRRVAFRTESQATGRHPDLLGYLEQEMFPAAQRLGATARVADNPDPTGGPFLIAHRREGPGLPTVLTYGHADVVLAEEHRWRAGLDARRRPLDGLTARLSQLDVRLQFARVRRRLEACEARWKTSARWNTKGLPTFQ